MTFTQHIRAGWQMTKASWRVFLLDKELTSLPLIGMGVTLLAMAPFIAIVLVYSNFGILGSAADGNPEGSYGLDLGYWTWPFWFAVYFVTTLISNFFAAAVIKGAMTRFRGGDPTVKDSLAGAWRKFRPLALFSLMMSTVGLLLSLLEERVPFAGKIAVWLVNAAWNIANFFALPIIVMDDAHVQPLQATKQSVRLVKKVWGESIVATGAMATITALAALAYILAVTLLGFAIGYAGLLSLPMLFIYIPLVFLGFMAIILVSSVLSGILKAALYHFATTGEAPETFNRELLMSAMTPKKARKIFG